MASQDKPKARSNLKNWFKSNWIGVLGIVLGSAIAWFFYNKSSVNRELFFLVEPARTEILSAERIAEAPIKIIRKEEGSEVTSDLTSVRFYFWNNGRLSIKKDNVLRDIEISLSDSTCKILDTKLLKRSREVTGLQFLRDKTDPGRSILIDFSILEQDDGATGQLIFEGNPQSTLVISGIIEGVKEISTSPPARGYWLSITQSVGMIILIIVSFAVLIMIGRETADLEKSRLPKRLRKIAQVIFMIFALGVLIFSIIGGVLRMAESVREDVSKNVVRYIPSSVLPD